MPKRWMAATVVLACGFNGALAELTIRERDGLLEQATQEIHSKSSALSGLVEWHLDRANATLQGISDIARLNPQMLAEPDGESHRLLLRQHMASNYLRSLFLLDGNGRMVASSINPNPGNLDFSDRDYVLAFQDGIRDAMFIGRPVYSKINGEAIIPFARPQRGQFNHLDGIIAGTFSAEGMEGLIAGLGFADEVRVVIARSDGVVLGCRGEDRCLSRSLPDLPPLELSEFRDDEGGGQDQDYYSNVRGPAAYHWSERYQLLILAQMDRAQVLRPWRHMLPYTIALGVVGTAFITMAAVAVIRQMRRRARAIQMMAETNVRLESKVAERTRDLKESEERLRGVILAARDAVIVIDEKGIIQEFNPSAAQMFGYSLAEAVGNNVTMLMPEDDARNHDSHVANSESEGQRAIGQTRVLYGRRKDGSTFPIELTVGTQYLRSQRVHVGVIRDITERKANEETLRRLANQDGLTGIFNRRHFFEEGERVLSLARRAERPLGVLMLDADHFKSVNDRFGHDVGDQVLKALAQTVAGTLRTSDLFGRMGGEEFALVLPDTDVAGAQEVAERILAAIRTVRVDAGDQKLGFTLSIGIAVGWAENLDDMLKRADSALYEAKHGGRDRAVLHAEDIATSG